MARDNDGAYSLNPPRETTDAPDSTRAPEPARRTESYAGDVEHRTKPAKTSAAAAFALVFGVAALIAVLTVILAPVALVLSLIGIVLGIVGMKMAKRVGITGKTVALGGLVLSVLSLLLAVTAAIGVTTFLNNDAAVTRMENEVSQLRDKLPTDVNVPQPDVDVN